MSVTLIGYLRMRHPKVNALTRPEAELLGIGYPMARGWVEKYGEIELDDEIVKKLEELRFGRYARVKELEKKHGKRRKSATRKKGEKRPNKMDRKTTESLEKLMKTIVFNGCKDAARMAKHLNKQAKRSPESPQSKTGLNVNQQ